MSQHVVDDNGMYEAQYVTSSPPRGERWYTCQICGLDFPESEVCVSGGAAFCYKYGCYKDMNERRH